MKFVVPHGAEARAVRRAVAGAVIEIRAGARSAASLPELAAGETVVVMGLCGALRELRAGDVVVYGRIAGAQTVTLDRGLAGTIVRAMPHARVVSAYTTDHVVTRAAARAELATRFDADVVDMEGAPLAAALAARGVSFAMVRVVSDDASRDLPSIENVMAPDGRLRPFHLAFAVARAPRAAVPFVFRVRAALATLTETARTVEELRLADALLDR